MLRIGIVLAVGIPSAMVITALLSRITRIDKPGVAWAAGKLLLFAVTLWGGVMLTLLLMVRFADGRWLWNIR